MLNIVIGKSGRPVVTGSGMFGYGISNITETSDRSIRLDEEEFTFDGAVSRLVNDGMTSYEAYKYVRAVV